MKKTKSALIFLLFCFAGSLLFSGCATHHGHQGAAVGSFTGATAGALIDSDNRWRGAAIGTGLGALLGGALTDTPRYHPPYSSPQPYYQPHPYYMQQRQVAKGATIGGVTGAAAGALIDSDNALRGSIIGGILGSIFGGSISVINSGASVPVLNP